MRALTALATYVRDLAYGPIFILKCAAEQSRASRTYRNGYRYVMSRVRNGDPVGYIEESVDTDSDPHWLRGVWAACADVRLKQEKK